MAKITRSNGTVRVSNVIKYNGEFTKSSQETMNYLLDKLYLITGLQAGEKIMLPGLIQRTIH